MDIIIKKEGEGEGRVIRYRQRRVKSDTERTKKEENSDEE